MSMTGGQDAPPLRVWVYTALILTGLLVFLGYEDRIPALRRIGESRAVQYMNLQRLDSNDAGKLKIIALGSSKVFYAVDYDDIFAQRLTMQTRPVVFRRLTWSEAKPADMESVLQRIVRHPPDWLLVESDLLLFDHSARFPIRDHLRPLEVHLNSLFTRTAGEEELRTNLAQNDGRDSFPTGQECLARQSPDMRLVYAVHVATWKTSTAAQRERYLRWLRVLHDRGTRIVLLGIPRAPWAQAVFPARLTAENRAVLNSLVNEEGFELWQSQPLVAGAFCDEAHMSALGRAQFSDWLAQRLTTSFHPPMVELVEQHVR
jgi:hypothetical protein